MSLPQSQYFEVLDLRLAEKNVHCQIKKGRKYKILSQLDN